MTEKTKRPHGQLKRRIFEAHFEHPEMKAGELAKKIGCTPDTICAYRLMYNLPIPYGRVERAN